MSTASDLAPVRVDDWIVFAGGEDFWVRDLDLAERAGLKQPRNIRAIIQKAIEDGAMTIGRGAHDSPPTIARGACDGPPSVRVEKVLTAIGSGATREVDEFYLNEEAALFIVTRLRTKAAVQLTRAVIRVFVMVRRGELPLPAAPAQPAPPAPALPAMVDALRDVVATQMAQWHDEHGPTAMLFERLDRARARDDMCVGRAWSRLVAARDRFRKIVEQAAEGSRNPYYEPDDDRREALFALEEDQAATDELRRLLFDTPPSLKEQAVTVPRFPHDD